MPSASNYTNKIRFAASVKNTKAHLQGNVGNLTQSSIAGCGLDILYSPIDYVSICGCSDNTFIPPQPLPPPPSPPPPPQYLYMTSIAGNGTAGYSGDDGFANVAQVNVPYGVSLDLDGNIYIADSSNNRIRKIDTNGIITTVVGTGTPGFGGDDGPAIDAQLYAPQGVTFDVDNNMYIADTGNHRIRVVYTDGTITTYAGTGTIGYSGDGGAAIAANLRFPRSVIADSDSNLYIADANNNVIRKVDTVGIIRTFAGNGIADYFGDGGFAINAKLNKPYGVAVDSSNNVYIADSLNFCIRKVSTSGIITTVAGRGTFSGYSGDGGPATIARMRIAYGVTIDSNGNMFIADSTGYRVRKVDTSGIITTITGDGTSGSSGDGGLAINAKIGVVQSLVAGPDSSIYIADTTNNRIRKLYYA
jgi:sugar lactone lactonase YvrE